MNDLLKKDLLASWYKDALSEAEGALKKEGYSYRECKISEEDYPQIKSWSTVWRIDLKTTSFKMQILLCLPMTYPDELPKIYVPEDTYRKIFPIPHIDNNRNICTFDPVVNMPNKDKPDEIVIESIKRAKKILEDGIAGANVSDYRDEFLAYWNLECNGKILSFFAPTEESCYLKLVFFSKSWGKFFGIISKETEAAKYWCEALKISCDESEICDVLYLPLSDFGLPPFPSTIKEFYERLDKYDKFALNKLDAFLRKENSKYFVAFSIITTTDRALGLLRYPKLLNKKIPGYRHGKAPLKLLINHFKEEKVLKFGVERVDKNRLFYRGGDGLHMAENVSLSVIGCGSIGSSLAASLVKTGISFIDLIDPDELSIENIARHYCGMSDIGYNKAAILSRRLREKFPHIKSTSYPKDILHLLLSENDFLNKYSLNVVSIGNLSVERRLNDLLLNKSIASPILFVWVEPLLVAGHALFVRPSSQGCFECVLDDQLSFKYKVVENSAIFIKREAGCQTSFIPFGALEIDLFTNKVTRFITSILNGDVADNTLLTWIGDIDSFRKADYKIADRWETATSYSEHKFKLPDGKCEFCQT